VIAAPTESPPALGVVPPLEPAPSPVTHRRALVVRGEGGASWWAAGVMAALICFATFYARGGLKLETMTTVEMTLTIVSGLLLAAVALTLPRGSRAFGLPAALALAALAALSAVSIVWSVQPDASWRDAGRMLAYTGVFAAAAALARLAPRRSAALLSGLTLAAVVICGYALVTKVFPDSFPAANKYARLYEPFGYWNATGLIAAMGAIGCMWLGARRTGHALVSALSFPAMGLLLTTLMLAYSRGALLALALGLVLWFALVPLRLRGAAVLIVGGLGAAVVTAWDFSNHALSSDGVELAQRTSAGHELGAMLVAVLALLALAGIAIGFAFGRRPPSAALRRRAGAALLIALALALLAFVGALAHSQRGLTGSVSHAFNTLTDTHAKVPNTPGRLTAIASVRAQYWNEALKAFQAQPARGVGAGGYEVARLRYRHSPLPVIHAHGFVVQTLADLGLAGALLALVLLWCWMAAAGRATHPFNRRWSSWREVRDERRVAWRRWDGPYDPERICLLSLLCVVVVFGAHSLIDWTWYVPGTACAALICAGWLAGRGPSETAPPRPARPREMRREPLRVALAATAVVAALLVAWSQWQPQRAEEAAASSLAALARQDPRAALADAQSAVSRDPLSIEALFTLADVRAREGQDRLARDALHKAVRMQPSNPATWLELARFDLAREPAAALKELQASIFLDPQSISEEALTRGDPKAIEIHNDYIQALRAVRSVPAAPAREAAARPLLGQSAPRSTRSRTPRAAR
jgi:O-antigen ligase